jgi:hypothetical protein
MSQVNCVRGILVTISIKGTMQSNPPLIQTSPADIISPAGVRSLLATLTEAAGEMIGGYRFGINIVEVARL